MFTEEFKKKVLPDLGRKKKANVDHILVRDYVREIDIGAFQPEYGVKQRVSFNVILEVNTDNQPMHDNVDLVLSYDNIIEVIEDEIGQKRVALLETLAEKIAISCLCLDSVITATVRLEKLDRGLGNLGVRISRTKVQPDASKTNLNLLHKNNLVIKTKIPNAGLLFISNRMLQQKNICYLREFISTSAMTWVICLSEIYKEFSDLNPETAFRCTKGFTDVSRCLVRDVVILEARQTIEIPLDFLPEVGFLASGTLPTSGSRLNELGLS